MQQQQILFKDADDALRRMHEILDRPSFDNVCELARLLLEKRRRLVLYLGAGCSAAVTLQMKDGSTCRGPLWNTLLDTLANQLGDVDQFRRDMAHRAGSDSRGGKKASDLLRYFDKLQLASHIGSALEETGLDRDQEIARIVEPPHVRSRESALLESMLQLPYSDIVTTNYDRNLEAFLDAHEERNPGSVRPFPIHSAADISSFLGDEKQARCVYLHGSVDELTKGERCLVLDRFDYARLLSSDRGLLGYVTGILRDSHVLYIGFGLDDPSFNFIEQRLYEQDGIHRPMSFSFVDRVTEQEWALWERRRMRLIKVPRIDRDLPVVVDDINTIIRFVAEAEPDRPSGARPTDDRQWEYLIDALRAYRDGHFARSWKACRAALASTLFWRWTASELSDEKGRLVCEIRIRHALNHYKLRHDTRSGTVNHEQLMDENINEADAILEEFDGRKLTDPQRDAWKPLRLSLDLLKARRKYYEPNYPEALRDYESFIGDAGKRIRRPGRLTSDRLLTHLRLAEVFYYSECQAGRIAYQTVRKDRSAGRSPLADRVSRSEHLFQIWKDVLDQVKQVTDRLGKPPGDRITRRRFEYFESSICALAHIARWTAGRHSIGVYREVFPCALEVASAEHRQHLNHGIGHLKWKYEVHENESAQPVAADVDSVSRTHPSPRWQALRLRYWARAFAVRWAVDSLHAGTTADDGDLIRAYTRLHEAFQISTGPALERELIINHLEGTRLNLLSAYVSHIAPSPDPTDGISPLTRGATMFYLNQAFLRLDRTKDPWLTALSYRLASYAALLIDAKARRLVESDEICAELRDFMRNGSHADEVCRRYEACWPRHAKSGLTDRIVLYRECYDRVRSELA